MSQLNNILRRCIFDLFVKKKTIDSQNYFEKKKQITQKIKKCEYFNWLTCLNINQICCEYIIKKIKNTKQNIKHENLNWYFCENSQCQKY